MVREAATARDVVHTKPWNHLLDYEMAHNKAIRHHVIVRGFALLLVTGVILSVVDLLPWYTDIVKAVLLVLAIGLTI